MKDILDDEDRKKRIKRNKDRDVLNRLVAIRLFLGCTGALFLFPVHTYFPGPWVWLPILWIIISLLFTIPIEYYSKKYDLREYEDIVAFFDEKYDY